MVPLNLSLVASVVVFGKKNKIWVFKIAALWLHLSRVKIKTNKLLKWSRCWIMQHMSFWTSTTHFGFVWFMEEGESPKLSRFLILSVHQFCRRSYLAYSFFFFFPLLLQTSCQHQDVTWKLNIVCCSKIFKHYGDCAFILSLYFKIVLLKR